MQHYDTIEVAKKKSIVTPLISTVTAVSCIQFDPRGHLTNMDTFFRHIGLPIRSSTVCFWATLFPNTLRKYAANSVQRVYQWCMCVRIPSSSFWMASWAVVHRTPVMTEANKTWGGDWGRGGREGKRENWHTTRWECFTLLFYWTL